MGEAMGWWGCLSCGSTVPNNHSGACPACGDRIGRILPPGTGFEIVDIVPALQVREPASPPPVVRSSWNHTALVAALVLCFASPLLGVSSAGWNAVAMGMALNIWSSSVGYYALSKVWGDPTAPA